MSDIPDPPTPQPEETATAPVAEVTPPPSGSLTPSSILPGAAPMREVIGDFEVLGKLGAGGMGAVYRARQVSLGRVVALKVLPMQFTEDADSVSRFQREARVAANLSHANLVKVYAAGVAEGCHYIAMELVEGEDLGRRLKREGRLAAPEALRLCVETARGLEYGWRTAHLIHRDIKPANIFIAENGEVKLGDLGLAKSLLSTTTGLTQTGTMMGTPHYMSPEQARGDREIDFRADIYSLGCTLYQMLTGQAPYGGSDAVTIIHQHIHGPLPAILKVWPQCPMPLARLIGRMLKKARHERPASYEELIAQLEGVWAQIEPLRFQARTFAPPEDPVRTPEAGTPPEVGKPRRGFPDETVEAAAEGRRGAPSPPAPKSKRSLYGGLAAAIVLGVAAFLAWPKPEKLTQAQLYARAHAETFVGQAPRLPASTAGGAPALQSKPAAATQDAPFVNTLGMKFVPVPIVGGPTSGQRLLFSVWDTRVQDYEVFVKETKREWPKADFEQGPTHPAVGVSWEDATAFCAWLTERERKAGKLGANEVYRLPTDHEWSCAVGLGGWEDAARLPSKKSQEIKDAFPWGADWPPSDQAGNYWSEELRPLLEAGKYTSITGELPGRRDGYANTSPVGSYAANRFGLYDLGGNVLQWCEDWFDKDQTGRVLRGASWNSYGRGSLLSSNRYPNAPTYRGSVYGFRIVVGVSAPGKSGTGVPPAESASTTGGTPLPLSATTDAPFVNTLGMKFVPVPITGGPTSGRRLLFSVWDTRVQDYEVFATETKRPWSKPDFEQGPTHPAVDVSWEDATAFCAWLTERERKAGKLGANEVYRLPTDHEWSCAVGIGDREDAGKLPNEKNQKIGDVFTWGTDWPPPDTAGNYWSEELRPLLEAGKYSWIKEEFPGRRDGYANTSPVGSYAANRFGLYDLSGNVLQWCEDWFDKDQKDRVLRGASWAYVDRGGLLLSYRHHGVATARYSVYGFRIVVGVSAPVKSGTGVPPAESASTTGGTPLPLAATTDAPFVNSLGMKFVPVPIVGGPTAGQRVLFGVWDVRAQDYAVYAAANPKVDGGWKTQNKDGVPAGHELDHPVVGVSWEDAQAFCQWLTQKEQAEGKLPQGMQYRLPTDEEWSWAVGLPPELGTTPAEKSGKNNVDFPWGKDYPPTRKVGNYADEAFHAKFPPKKNEKENRMENPWIEGYDDGYATTSPVGSFPANVYGLYDMGGNVWQWCEDWFDASRKDASRKERVLRGEAWHGSDRGNLLSSNRGHNTPAGRNRYDGFRCVVGVSAR